jgi:lectin family protein/caspase domain-containing protein
MDGKRSALIVASYDYEDPGLRLLRAPARDAEALAGVLQDPEIGDFEVRTVLNEPAHVVNLAVEEFFAERGPEDLLVLHFSCHGLKDETGELYFAAADTKLRRLGATAVSADFVNRRMSRSRSRRIVLLLDCCYAGAFERGMMARADKAVHLEEQFGGRGRAVITASGAMEYAFEDAELTASSELRPSVFTRALVEGLETGDADRDQDGQIGLDELYDYVYDRVQEVTPNQTPGKWTFAIQGELFIARRRSPVAKPAPLPAGLQQALEQPLSGIRLGAVHELERLLGARHAGLALAAKLALERLRDDDSRAVAAAAAAVLDAHGLPAAVEVETLVPQVALSTSEIDFGRMSIHSEPPSRAVEVRNTGGGRLNARVAGAPEWVHAELTADRLVLTVDPAVIGVLTGEVLVETDGGPATVRVTAHIDPRPRLVVDPSVVDFGRLATGAPVEPRRVEVRNAGGGKLAWQHRSSGDFFEVQREPHALIVWLRPRPGRHSGSVSLRSDGGDAVVQVTAEITAASPKQQPDPEPAGLRSAGAERPIRGPEATHPAAGAPWWRRRLAVWGALAIIAGLVATVAVVAGNGGSANPPSTSPATRPQPSQLVKLRLVGDAVTEGDRVRLTSAAIDQVGAAWSTDKKNVQQPFTVTFHFQITDARIGGGADGIAFVIQNDDSSSLGKNGGGIGYDGIPNSVAVEFDTSQTPVRTPPMTNVGDPNSSHIGVHTRGRDPNSADEKFVIGEPYESPNLKDGRPHAARISYRSGQLDIYLDNSDTPVLTVRVNLATTLKLANGTAWIGLTAATGKYAERHDVWSMAWQPS